VDGSVDTARSQGAIASLLGPGFVRKFFKYAMTSVVSVIISQSALYTMASVWEWDAVVANLIAVAIGTVPSYYISRYWVWNKTGKSSLYAEVVPFWAMTFLGLGLSTLCVWFLQRQWPDSPWLANVGNIAGFGVLWVAKFFILDRLLFKVTHEHIETPTPVL
jgi:putative flippase GtrA